MGCDIHIHAEIQIMGEWCHVDPPGSVLWHQGKPFPGRKDAEKMSEYQSRGDIHGNRWYAAFAALAGVRNYDGIPCPIPPRGTPRDVTRRTEEDVDHWSGDGHTHSWWTLEELDEYGVGLTCWRPNAGDCGDFDWPLLPWLRELSKAGPVRIVFWFDN